MFNYSFNTETKYFITKKKQPFPERLFHVGKYLELRFEFRTSEMQGVILSVAEPVGFPAISIELHKGKVNFWAFNCIQTNKIMAF